MKCKIYDRFFVKQCLKCLKYGHSSSKCTDDLPVCKYCSENHCSDDCKNKTQLKCKNCIYHGFENISHSATDRINCNVYKSRKQWLENHTEQ